MGREEEKEEEDEQEEEKEEEVAERVCVWDRSAGGGETSLRPKERR